MPNVAIPAEFESDPSAYVWTHYAPEIGAAAGQYSLAVYENSKLSMREMEAARIRTAQINGCALCLNRRAGRDLPGHIERSGGDVARAASTRDTTPPSEGFYDDVENWREAAGFSDREMLAIEYAERLGERPKGLKADADFWRRMHTNFSDAEIVDMTFSIGSWIALGRLTHVLGLDDYCMPTMPQVTQI
jgi:alkylhydroperoxidase family enzyme